MLRRRNQNKMEENIPGMLTSLTADSSDETSNITERIVILVRITAATNTKITHSHNRGNEINKSVVPQKNRSLKTTRHNIA